MTMPFIAGVLACAEAEVTPLGAPQLVLSEIRLGGAQRVAERIDSDLRFGQTVMEGIATGDSLWLEVARNLEFKSAAAEANFAIALSAALPRNPDAVLSLIGPKARVNDVCGMPFLEATPEAVSRYYDSSIAALARPRAPSASAPDRPRAVSATALARTCVATLDSARVRKLARIDPAYLIKNKPVAPKPSPRRRRRARPAA